MTLAEARTAAGWRKLVDDVAWKLVEMPLPRLQRVGSSHDSFIYDIAWDDTVKRRQLRDPAFDPVIHLRPGAGDHLVRLVGVLRPLIEREWAARVCRYNPGVSDQTADLESFLFGADRLGAVRLRLALLELQDGRCFYTGERITSITKAHVDHFLPWARKLQPGVPLWVRGRSFEPADPDAIHVALSA